jgi:nucleoside-diphosphate-sugar epimerase
MDGATLIFDASGGIGAALARRLASATGQVIRVDGGPGAVAG